MTAATFAVLVVLGGVSLLAIACECRRFVVELVRRLDRDYHGRGCDGPYNCTCGGGR